MALLRLKYWWGIVKACVGRDIWPPQKRWANDRYFDRQAMWKRIHWEHEQMNEAFKTCFGRDLDPHPKHYDDPPKPPFPEVM